MSETYGAQLILIKLPAFETEILKFICQRSNSLYNQAIYFVRQTQALTHPGLLPNTSYAVICSELKDEWNYSMLCAQAAQQTLKSVTEAIDGYKGLMSMWWSGGLETEPKQPQYRKRGGLFPVTYPASAVTFYLDRSEVRIPLDNSLKEELGISELFILCPNKVRCEDIKEIQILPRNGEFYAVYVYKTKSFTANVDFSKALGIDPGLSNWLTCVSTEGKSFIIDGHFVKSLNQRANKIVATIKKGKAQDYWDEQLAFITERRNRQIRDCINKAARFIINRCLAHRIGTIVFGWNQGNKNSINIGKKNNQEFVQLPTARLKNRIAKLCKQYGLRFVKTKESYTSKSSYLDNDFLPTYGGEKPAGLQFCSKKRGQPSTPDICEANESPETRLPSFFEDSTLGWKPSGKRGKKGDKLGCGQYKTSDGSLINSDCNGAVNILRKVSTQLGLSLAKVSKAALTLPQRYNLDSLSRFYREKNEAARLKPTA